MSTTIIFNDLSSEQIETVKAFAHAVKSKSKKDIECRHIDGNWGDIVDDGQMNVLYTYRIKPQPKIVPFTFEDAKRLIGQTIIIKEKNEYAVVISVHENFVETKNDKFGFGYLEQYCTFLDGSPIGKKE